jgi:hypothetical protein
MCRFCEKEGKVSGDGFCRKCLPIFRHNLVQIRAMDQREARKIGPPTFWQYCIDARASARKAVRAARNRGELPSLRQQEIACVDCGKRATIWEHRDYTRPLDVQPVCIGCNTRRGHGYPHPKIPLEDLVPRDVA